MRKTETDSGALTGRNVTKRKSLFWHETFFKKASFLVNRLHVCTCVRVCGCWRKFRGRKRNFPNSTYFAYLFHIKSLERLLLARAWNGITNICVCVVVFFPPTPALHGHPWIEIKIVCIIMTVGELFVRSFVSFYSGYNPKASNVREREWRGARESMELLLK